MSSLTLGVIVTVSEESHQKPIFSPTWLLYIDGDEWEVRC